MSALLPRILNLLLQFVDSFGFLVLSAIGLAVIFGMMGVINLAHGEFITVGAYSTAMSYHAGVPLPIAIIFGIVITTIFGLIVEYMVIRRLYGRLLDSMVATWGLSLILIQGLRIIFGSSIPNIGTPLGSIQYGEFSYSIYRLLLTGVSLLLLAGLYWVFMNTEFGIRARATIQNEEMARSLGTNTNQMYLITFGIGSALAGLTGALYAPTMTLVPGMGSTFLVEAFVTVIVGGASVLLGTTLAGGLLGFINAVFSNLFGTFAGRMALLITTIFIIRILPTGITGYLESRGIK